MAKRILEVVLAGNADGLKRTLSGAGRDVDAFGSKVNAHTAILRKQQRTIGEIGNVSKRAAQGFGIAAVGAAATIIKTGAAYEQQMSRVKAVTSANADEMRALNREALKLGKDTKFSAKQAADAMYELASAGFSVKETQRSLPGVMALAAASNTDLARAAEISSNALRGFGLDASQSTHVADVLTLAVNKSSVEMSDLGDSMKYVGPISRATGQSFEDVTAAIAEMGNAGIKGEQAGTTLRGGLLQLTKPTKQVWEAFDSLGIKTNELYGPKGLKPLPEMVRVLREHTDGLTVSQKNQALAQIFGKNAATGMFAIIQQGPEKLAKLSAAFEHSDGAAKKASKTMMDNVSGSFEQLKGSAETLAISLYQKVAPQIKTALDGATGDVNAFMDALNSDKGFKSGDDIFGAISRSLKKSGISEDLKKLDIGGKVEDALNAALPIVAKGAAYVGVTAVKAFAHGFTEGDPLTKLALGAFFIQKFVGWKTVFGKLGIGAGASFERGLAAATGSRVPPPPVTLRGSGGLTGINRNDPRNANIANLNPGLVANDPRNRNIGNFHALPVLPPDAEVGRAKAAFTKYGSKIGSGLATGLKGAVSSSLAQGILKGGALALVFNGIAAAVAAKGGPGEKLQSALSGLTAGLVPDPEMDRLKAADRLIKNMGDHVHALAAAGNAKGIHDAAKGMRELANLHWVDKGKMLDAAESIDHIGARLDALTDNFGRMRKGSVLNIKDLRAAVASNFSTIQQVMGARSAKGAAAVAQNTANAVAWIKKYMSDGGKVTRQGMAEIEKVFRAEMRLYGISGNQANADAHGRAFSLGGNDSAGTNTRHGNARGGWVRRAVGGWIGSQGEAGRDTVPMMLPEGTPVINRHQMAALGLASGGMVPTILGRGEFIPAPDQVSFFEQRAAERGYGGLDGLFGAVDRPHYLAKGGKTSHASRLLAAMNRVSAKNWPYRLGGGHEQPARFEPFDCSGAVSYVTQQAGYKVPTAVSGAMGSWPFPRGGGAATIYYNPEHTFMKAFGRFFGTSGFARPNGGAGWFNQTPSADYLKKFSQIHLPNLGGADAGMGSVRTPRVTGPKGALRSIVQGAVTRAAKAANARLHAVIAASGGGGGGQGLEAGGGYNGPLNRVFPKHFIDQPGVQLSKKQVRKLASNARLNPNVFDPIAHGESDRKPGVEQRDPGDGMVGTGLLQATPNAWGAGSVLHKILRQFGGIDQMRNPVKAMLFGKKQLDLASSKTPNTPGFPWYGTKYLAAGGRASLSRSDLRYGVRDAGAIISGLLDGRGTVSHIKRLTAASGVGRLKVHGNSRAVGDLFVKGDGNSVAASLYNFAASPLKPRKFASGGIVGKRSYGPTRPSSTSTGTKAPSTSRHFNPFTGAYEFLTADAYRALQHRWQSQHPTEPMPTSPASGKHAAATKPAASHNREVDLGGLNLGTIKTKGKGAINVLKDAHDLSASVWKQVLATIKSGLAGKSNAKTKEALDDVLAAAIKHPKDKRLTELLGNMGGTIAANIAKSPAGADGATRVLAGIDRELHDKLPPKVRNALEKVYGQVLNATANLTITQAGVHQQTAEHKATISGLKDQLKGHGVDSATYALDQVQAISTEVSSLSADRSKLRALYRKALANHNRKLAEKLKEEITALDETILTAQVQAKGLIDGLKDQLGTTLDATNTKMHTALDDALKGLLRSLDEKLKTDLSAVDTSAAGLELKGLTDAQAADARAAEDASQQKTLADAQYLANHSGGKAKADALQAVKDAQKAIDDTVRQRRIEDLQKQVDDTKQHLTDTHDLEVEAATKKSEDDGIAIDAETEARKAGYGNQLAALYDFFTKGKIGWTQYVNDLNAILGPLGIGTGGPVFPNLPLTPDGQPAWFAPAPPPKSISNPPPPKAIQAKGGTTVNIYNPKIGSGQDIDALAAKMAHKVMYAG